MRMKSLNVRKKIREPSNVTKKLSYVMLELHNMRMKPFSIKCEKKVKELPNMTK